MLTRRSAVGGLLLAAGGLARAAGTGLAAEAARAGVLFGSEATAKVLRDRPYAGLLAAECALLVDGADLLPINLCPAPGRFDFADADAVFAFANTNGLAFRGHNLVWHLSQAEWLPGVPRREAASVLKRHIATVCGRYAGRVHSWDVVNECVDPDDGNPWGLCNSPWLGLLGPDYVRQAFEAARAADARARLCLNESGLEGPGRDGRGMRVAMLRLLERLLRDGVPVHALGVECHLDAGRDSLDTAAFGAFLQEVAAFGLEVFVTELDASDRRMPPAVAARDKAVAATYAMLLEVALSCPAVTTVVTWGLSDRHSWLGVDEEVRRPDGLPSRGALFDGALRPKGAYGAAQAAFRRRAAERPPL